MTFDAPGEHYERFMGRFSRALAPLFADAAGIAPGMRVLDVGCGTGALTGELVTRLGTDAVAAIDPSPPFVAACRERYRGVEVREGAAESLPWPDAEYDAALACLVVAFMKDPGQGLREMVRVTRPGGRVAACVWDIEGERQEMLAVTSRAVRSVRPDIEPHPQMTGARPGDLARLLTDAGAAVIVDAELTCRASYDDFADFWEPVTFGVGPVGDALRSMPPAERDAVESRLREELPTGPFTLSATAWCAVGTV